MKPAKPKRPAKSAATSYARHVDADGKLTGWRLFRRSSVDRRLFHKDVQACPFLNPQSMARDLLVARTTLRATVDHYDLIKLGLTP